MTDSITSDWSQSPSGHAALGLLRHVLAPQGFLASPAERANYRRVWARDGVVCGLAGLAAGEADLADGLRRTVETLTAHAGPQGQMPSNVAFGDDGGATAVSYGGLAGRVDAGLWTVLGAARWAAASGDRAWTARMAPSINRALVLFDAWEFNGRGLVYVPQSGDWADEYDLHGYVLMDQVLRLAALREWVAVAPDGAAAARTADRIEPVIAATFWPRASDDTTHVYHPRAHARVLDEPPAPFPFAALTPAGYVRRFDALGSALALGLTDLWPDRTGALLDAAQRLASQTSAGLVPAFAPTIVPGDPAYEALRGTVRDTFSNRPGHYHNGGLWPMVNGWWAAALARHGRTGEARSLADRLDAANTEGNFPEYLDAETGKPHGTAPLAWSAAGAVLARSAAIEAPRATEALALMPAPVEGPAPDRAGSSPAVVVAGEILVDLLSAEPADAIGEAAHFERHAGGSPANLARTLAGLGVSTALVASVGDDSFGRFLDRSARASGVDLRLARRTGVPTSLAVVARSAATPDFLLYRTADRFLTPEQLPDALLGAARVFHTSGFALSREPGRTALLDAADRATSLGTAVSVDVNFAPETPARRAEQLGTAERLLALGALVKSSRDDAERLFGSRLPDAEAIGRYHAWGARLVCFTLGAEGALVSWDGHLEAVPPTRVETVVDATGAGDAFWAGFLAAWLRGQSPPDCTRAGGRVAALKLGRAGPLGGALESESLLGLS